MEATPEAVPGPERPVSGPTPTRGQAAAAQQLAAVYALTRIRAAFDGPLVVLKGLEIAARYGDPSERASGDVDVLTSRPEHLQELLLADGYVPLYDTTTYGHHHHLAPLGRPGLPLVVEVHRSPGWLPGMTPPTTEELIRRAVPSRAGVDGVLTLDPADHVVYLAVHSWQSRPFAARDLSDMARFLEEEGVAEQADARAVAWGVHRIWSRYVEAIAAPGGIDYAPPLIKLIGRSSAKEASARLARFPVRLLARFMVDHPVRRLPHVLRGLNDSLLHPAGVTRGGASLGDADVSQVEDIEPTGEEGSNRIVG